MFQRSGLVRPNVPEDRWQHVTVLSSAPTVTAGRIPGRCAEGEQEVAVIRGIRGIGGNPKAFR